MDLSNLDSRAVARARKLMGQHSCPVCHGTGMLSAPNKVARDLAQERKEMAKVLRDHGYSIRQIADFLGWKSPRSVVVALEQ